MGERFLLCFPRMRQVFSFVDTHVLAAEEPPVLLILIFSYKINLPFFGQLFLAGARVIPGIGWGPNLASIWPVLG